MNGVRGKCALSKCAAFERRNSWQCSKCSAEMNGGIVFVTGISGSDVEGFLHAVVKEASTATHEHKVAVHDIGGMMKKFAEEDDPDVQWNRVLDADERVLRHLRAMAFLELKHAIQSRPDTLHLVDLHLAFRWAAYLTRGFEPHILEAFNPHVRIFINIIEDLPKVQERLKKTAWGDRTILELLLWRDEELFLTNLFADTCGRVDCIAVARGEPAALLERLILAP